ncbi:MAG: GTPase ObgE [Candidatus Roizmanbacteria bacterium]|nr:GTPase ObgE [Candidatus Roizmanbacteria bacterium]
MLIDEVRISVRGGNGGPGLVSFRREKFIPRGGPDGGNGGHGGNVYVQGVDNIRYLKKYHEKNTVEGIDGQPGASSKRTGASGKDTLFFVPVGSRVIDHNRNSAIDILDTTTTHLIALGGRGGKGNWEFRSATNQAPRTAQPGTQGQRADVEIRLMLIADIGLIGLPNAGKSSLLNALTSSAARVGDYPFTTLEPNLGRLGKYGKTIADIPGLIEGASKGKGLGTSFLKHIERTRLLVHCISAESDDMKRDYETVRKELNDFNPSLLSVPEIIAITKSDTSDPQTIAKQKKKLSNLAPAVYVVSIVDDTSIETLRHDLAR